MRHSVPVVIIVNSALLLITEVQKWQVKHRCFVGNAIGDEGIEEVRNWLDANGKEAALGSMSDDEGEVDDDDDESDEDEGEEKEGDRDTEGDDEEASDNLDLSITGVSLKPQSPLLRDDCEVEKELNKVRHTVCFCFFFLLRLSI